MSTIFGFGEKLYAKRDKINVFVIPNGGGPLQKWPYRPMRSAPGEGLRDYKRFDELGPFYREIDIEGERYLEVVSWDNASPTIGSPYTIVRNVYVKFSEDAVLTDSQKRDAEQQEANDEVLNDLQSRFYPEWSAQGINLPSKAYFEKDKSGNSVLYLEFTGPPFNKITFEKFDKLDLSAKITASGVRPNTGTGNGNGNSNGNGNGNGSGTGNGTGTSSNTIVYAVLAVISVMVLGMTFMFIRKRRSPAPLPSN